MKGEKDRLLSLAQELKGVIVKKEKTKPTPSKINLKGLPSDLHSIEPIGTYNEVEFDSFDNITTIFKVFDNYKLGFDRAAYLKLIELANQILSFDTYSERADFEFLQNICFEWSITGYIDNSYCETILEFLDKEIVAKTFDRIYYFRINSLLIEAPFKIGEATFTFFTQDFLDNHYEKIKKKSSTELKKQEFDSLYKEFRDKILCVVSVNSISSRSLILAKKKAAISLSALKCVCIDESMNKRIKFPEFDFQQSDFRPSLYLTKQESQGDSFGFNLSNEGMGDALVIASNNWQKISLGLAEFDKFISLNKRSELYSKTEELITLFSKALSTVDLQERAVQLVSYFESIIINENAVRSKGQTLLKRNIVPKFPENDDTDFGRIINSIYNIRDRYLHNKTRLHVDLMDLYKFQRFGLMFLFFTMELNRHFDTTKQFLKHFKIETE